MGTIVVGKFHNFNLRTFFPLDGYPVEEIFKTGDLGEASAILIFFSS